MKIKNAFMAALALSGATPALAQTANPVHRDAPVLNQTPYPDSNDRYEEPQSDRERLIDIGYEYARENYERLANRQTGGDRNQVTNSYNNSSVTNRVLRRFAPERIGGGVGRVLGDCGFGSGTTIGGLQKLERHDSVMAPHVIQGMEAAQNYSEAMENNDRPKAEYWSRIADSSFFNVGRLVERYDTARYEQGERSAQRCTRRPLQRFLRNHPSPLRRFP